MPHLETVKRAKRPEHLPDVFTVQEAKDSLEADGEAARQFRGQSVVLSDGAIHAGQREPGDGIPLDRQPGQKYAIRQAAVSHSL